MVAITDISGSITSQQRYLPFGQVRTDVPSPNPQFPITDLGYTGQRALDAGMGGLMDYHARFYDPYLNHFTQPDSITPGGPQGLNRYSYVTNSPINFNDPSGHKACGDGEDYDCTGKKQDPNVDPYKPLKKDNDNKEKAALYNFIGSHPDYYKDGPGAYGMGQLVWGDNPAMVKRFSDLNPWDWQWEYEKQNREYSSWLDQQRELAKMKQEDHERYYGAGFDYVAAQACFVGCVGFAVDRFGHYYVSNISVGPSGTPGMKSVKDLFGISLVVSPTTFSTEQELINRLTTPSMSYGGGYIFGGFLIQDPNSGQWVAEELGVVSPGFGFNYSNGYTLER